MLFFGFFSSFFEKSSSFCRENEIFKNKTKEILDQFLTLEKAKIGPVLTLQHIYIYIYIERERDPVGRKFCQKNRETQGTRVFGGDPKKFHICEFFRATSEAKSHYFPSGSLFFSKKCPKPTRKMTFFMSSWPFVALVLRIP